MSTPRVSVVVPVYEMGRYLPDAVASIEAQGRDDVEIIVVDDGSTDDTPAVIAGLGDRVTAIRQDNAGPSAARNRALEIARGEFIAFCDADDLWPEGKLALQLGRLDAEPDLDIVLGRIRYVAVDGGEVPVMEYEDPDAKTATHVHLGSGVYRRRAFDRVGGFDESLRMSEDTDWFMRARELGVRTAILTEVTLVYRRHGNNMTHELKLDDSQMMTVLKRSLDRRRALSGQRTAPELDAWRANDERAPSTPTVSVVIPAYDSDRYLPQAIRSVLAQDHVPLEILVVDDGSTDDTVMVARRFGSLVTVIRCEHRGIAATRNAGIAAARGEVVAFLDADDVWLPDKLARQVALLVADPDLELVFGGVEQFVSPELVGQIPEQPALGDDAGRIPSTFVTRASTLARVGTMDESVTFGDFIDWYDRAIAAGCQVAHVDDVVARRRIHDANAGRRFRSERADYARTMKQILDRRRAAAADQAPDASE
ncbi:MAG: glycosyltransferase family A protein [Acidimicrobiia bacterium]